MPSKPSPFEHEYCGELDAGVEEDRVYMTVLVIIRELKPNLLESGT